MATHLKTREFTSMNIAGFSASLRIESHPSRVVATQLLIYDHHKQATLMR